MRAFIFDLDGTLAQTSAVWHKAETALFAALSEPWREDIYPHYVGMNADDVAATVHHFLQPGIPLAECQELMRVSLSEAYRDGEIEAVPGAVQLVRRLHGSAPMAVASGSPLSGIETVVRKLGVAGYFERLLSSESVSRGKPHPDVFLRAAELLGADPRRCIVFEDSPAGLESACSAGMRAIVRPSHHPVSEFSGAAAVVESWDDVTNALIDDLVCPA